MPQPDFNELLRVLQRQWPSRPVLFELILNSRLIGRFADPVDEANPEWGIGPRSRIRTSASRNLGYDYTIVAGAEFGFAKGDREKDKSTSMSEGGVITDRASFARYAWPDPAGADYSGLDEGWLPEGMKFIVWGPGGILENVVSLMGYNALCFQLADEPHLVGDIFDAVGSRLVEYYRRSAAHESVGACIVNDDWGFKSQTMLAPDDMRKYVIPWHKRMVEAIHEANRPAILHSCGNLEAVMDDIIDTIGFDAKHSYEDVIEPVERAYDRWGGRIAILGGIDVDFLCRRPLDDIRRRSRAMLDKTAGKGYALGSGNSIPDYVPDEAYLAMIETAGR